MEDTQKKLDKALKRNLRGQQAQSTPAPTKTTSSDLSSEEPIADPDEPDQIDE